MTFFSDNRVRVMESYSNQSFQAWMVSAESEVVQHSCARVMEFKRGCAA